MSKGKDRWTQDILIFPYSLLCSTLPFGLCAWITCNPSHVEDLKYANRHSANSLYSSFGWSTENFFLASTFRFCFFCFFFLLQKENFTLHKGIKGRALWISKFKVQTALSAQKRAKEKPFPWRESHSHPNISDWRGKFSVHKS